MLVLGFRVVMIIPSIHLISQVLHSGITEILTVNLQFSFQMVLINFILELKLKQILKLTDVMIVYHV